ncbi:MAG: ATP-binding cassette domain-containing protein [Chloroflexia bacterium]|nr:ATP-binding cassette domain-containing protein [Chloroflexia bacterium]
MGGSGSGKTTLLNILNGNIKPQKGELLINGKNFVSHQEIKSLIGYVPQDDSLIEELTIFENLYYMSRFCYSGLTKSEHTELVNNLLIEIDLFEVKDLKVGSMLNKFISGGQRKRLNIALELIREPQILLVDEPTSGLSSADAERIIYLLAEQVTKGRLVITNIHQPSSDIFKLFDKLILLDKGGYPAYEGSPAEVFEYFRQKTGRIDVFKSFTKHGYFIPEEIFRLLEEKKLDDYGEIVNERIREPEEWHQYYLNEIKGKRKDVAGESLRELPMTNLQKPNRLKQTGIYFSRNFKTKLGDYQYMLISLLIAPVLAIILGYFTKNTQLNEAGNAYYLFSTNENIPSFFFMSVIVSLFIGLIVSAEEIIDDKKLLLRESFLSLSKSAYLHSKIFFLFLLSFIQTALYVVLSIIILKIPDIGIKLFLILFSLSCFANILGLVISALMRSVIAIYITIPLILIPQLLLSGVVVDYEDLHYSISSPRYTPVAGDLMASRWGLEALMVEQFKNTSTKKCCTLSKRK